MANSKGLGFEDFHMSEYMELSGDGTEQEHIKAPQLHGECLNLGISPP